MNCDKKTVNGESTQETTKVESMDACNNISNEIVEKPVDAADNESVDAKTKTENLKQTKSESQQKVDEENLSCKKECPFMSKQVVPSAKSKEAQPEDKSSIKYKIENESRFRTDCKLYFYVSETKSLETRGEGKLYIFINKSGFYTMLFMRSKIGRVGAYHIILPSKACNLVKSKTSDYSWCWVAVDDQADIADKYKTSKTVFLAKFNNEEKFDEFESVYKEAQTENAKILETKNA